MTVAAAAARKPRPATTPAAPARRQPPPALHVVPAPPWRAPLAPFILVSVGVVVAGLLGLLLLNTLVAQDSFRVHQLERDSTTLRERSQLLASEVARLEAPEVLARRAEALGLVSANSPGFLRLLDGRVSGDAKVALAPAPASPPAPASAPATVAPLATATAPGVQPKPPAPAKQQPAAKAPAAKTPTAHKPAPPQQPVPKRQASTRPAPKRPASTRPATPASTRPATGANSPRKKR